MRPHVDPGVLLMAVMLVVGFAMAAIVPNLCALGVELKVCEAMRAHQPLRPRSE